MSTVSILGLGKYERVISAAESISPSGLYVPDLAARSADNVGMRT